ncbi:MAG TPA: ABC transporter ATP-binding protein [Acetobacteraceae bacterium]|nr:ABC transporter ATP-binding protein [Acetobacteraceae bacterium]
MSGGVASAALGIEDLASGYGEAIVVRGVSLEVAPGSVLAVLGKNGMGKTTLLKTIMGFLPPRQGRIRVLGQDVTRLAPYRLSARAVTYSPQDQAIFQDLTVEENLRLGLRRRAAFVTGLERVAAYFPFLPNRRSQRAGTLSGGEQKMLIIARALMADPKLMLVDEITEGLQPSVIARLAQVLIAQRDAGTAILLIEQNIRFALSVADRYAVLARGEIVDSGDVRPGAEASIADHLTV